MYSGERLVPGGAGFDVRADVFRHVQEEEEGGGGTASMRGIRRSKHYQRRRHDCSRQMNGSCIGMGQRLYQQSSNIHVLVVP